MVFILSLISFHSVLKNKQISRIRVLIVLRFIELCFCRGNFLKQNRRCDGNFPKLHCQYPYYLSLSLYLCNKIEYVQGLFLCFNVLSELVVNRLPKRCKQSHLAKGGTRGSSGKNQNFFRKWNPVFVSGVFLELVNFT